MRSVSCGLKTSRIRRAFGVVSGALAVGVLVLSARHFAEQGWPLRDANPRLVGVAGGFFLLAYAFKAYGWQWLFRPTDRPQPRALAAAGGAASVTGAALPGRFDDVVRVAVLRRFPTTSAKISTVCVSLVMLGLIDAAALTPFSAAAAATADAPIGSRAALAVVAAGGLGAAAIVAGMPRLSRSARFLRYRFGSWLADHVTPHGDARQAAVFVLASWTVRAAGLFFLMAALELGISFPLAIAYLSATAASSALPISPVGGAVTQAGAGAAILVASGVPFGPAIAFAVAAQALMMLAGAAVLAATAAREGATLVAARLRAA